MSPQAFEYKEIKEKRNLGGETAEWNSRMVKLASSEKILFFEELFYEFLGNMGKKSYRSAIVMLEDHFDKKEYKRLLAMMGNLKLRKKYFGL